MANIRVRAYHQNESFWVNFNKLKMYGETNCEFVRLFVSCSTIFLINNLYRHHRRRRRHRHRHRHRHHLGFIYP
jgi:hypothetical protein